MLHHDREFFLLRIMTGILQYGKLEIRQPNKYLMSKAIQKYIKTYDRCKRKKLYTDEQALKDMEMYGLWTEDDQDNLEILPERIENYKVQLFDNILRPLYQEKIRLHLDSCKKQYDELFHKRHKFDYLTAEGISHLAKWQFIITNSTYYKNKRFNWKSGSKHNTLDFYYKNMVTEEEIRILCTSQPWSSYWSSKEMCASLFGSSTSDLTSDQLRLIYWSTLYDQVYDQDDVDPAKIIADQDIFDGWLITRGRKRKGDQKAGFIKNNKIANSQEIFIGASNKKEAKDIQNMNVGVSKSHMAQRLKVLKQEGEVKHHHFADVQKRRHEK